MKPLYLISDGGIFRSQEKFLSTVKSVFELGHHVIGFFQLREQVENHSVSDREVLELLQRLLPLCRKYEIKLILNRRIDIAKISLADGVHLGKHSISIPDARLFLQGNFLIGYSAHSVEEAKSALQAGADYVFLSPIFSPLSKTSLRPNLGTQVFKEFSEGEPVFALGGITPQNASSCLQAGATGVCSLGAVFLDKNPIQSIKNFTKILT